MLPTLADGAGAKRRAHGQLWADLMQRTVGLDVLACPRCGGRLRLIALIERAAVIDRILRHLGLPTAIPAPVLPAPRQAARRGPASPAGTMTDRPARDSRS